MRLVITTIGTVGKNFSTGLEKDEGDNLQLMAHLNVGQIFLRREQFGEILGQGPDFLSTLWRETGDPVVPFLSLAWARTDLVVTGKIIGSQAEAEAESVAQADLVTGEFEKVEPPRLILMQATFSGISFAPTDLGVNMTGKLSWLFAGDEAEDCGKLQGKLCAIEWTLTDWMEWNRGQKDLAPTAGNEPGSGPKDPVAALGVVAAARRFKERLAASGMTIDSVELTKDGGAHVRIDTTPKPAPMRYPPTKFTPPPQTTTVTKLAAEDRRKAGIPPRGKRKVLKKGGE